MKNDRRRTGTTARRRFARPAVVGEFQIELNGRKVAFTLKRSNTARLVWLRISPDKGLSVTVPSSYNIQELNGYLLSRSSWIERNLEKYCPVSPPPVSSESNTAEKISFLGKYFTLKHNGHSGGFTAIAQDKDALDFNLLSAFGETSSRGMKKWLKEQAAGLILEKVKIFSKKMNISPNRIYIKDQKSLWGSCSTRKNLSFNWRLIMAPEIVIDYVIVHELCHLKEMNHSKTFWKLVAEYSPEWRVHRRWLTEHCYELKTILPGK